jgi:predicted metalloprotease with PDZ domain
MAGSWSSLALFVAFVFTPSQEQRPQPPVKEAVRVESTLTNPVLLTDGAVRGDALWIDVQPREGYLLTAPLVRYHVNQNTATLNGWSRALGVSLAEVDAPLQVHLGLKAQEGVLILGVDPEGAAAKASLQVHDVLLGLPTQVDPSRSLELMTVRAGARQKVTLTVPTAKQFWIGVHTSELDDAMRTQLSLPAGRGILITEVIEKTPAQAAGLLKHDVGTGTAEGTAVDSAEAFSKLVQSSGGKTLQLQIIRHAKSMSIGITPVARPQEQAQQSQQRDAAVANGLLWLRAYNNLHVIDRQPWTVELAGQAAQDPAVKVDALQKQVEALLKEVTALRQAMEKQKAGEGAPPKK